MPIPSEDDAGQICVTTARVKHVEEHPSPYIRTWRPEDRLDDVEKVFAEIKARASTPNEISERSGVGILMVEKILCLLTDFDFAVKDGKTYRASKEWAALRLGPGKELL